MSPDFSFRDSPFLRLVLSTSPSILYAFSELRNPLLHKNNILNHKNTLANYFYAKKRQCSSILAMNFATFTLSTPSDLLSVHPLCSC